MSSRQRLRPLKEALAAVVAAPWRAGFALRGLARRGALPRWRSPGGERVLVVSPHPDDEAIGCGGAMLRHGQCGDSVCVAIATDGRRSRAVPDPEEMAARRLTECRTAAALLGVARLEWLGLREGDWESGRLSAALRALLDEWRPALVYAPSRVDFHPEHRAVAHALASALVQASSPPRAVRVYEVQVPLTDALVNLVCEIDAVRVPAEAALHAYETQRGSTACVFRRRRYAAARHRAGEVAEEFWEMPPACYIALHAEPPTSGTDGYRGLRNFPLTDPLAYLSGRARRARLRQHARPQRDGG